MADAAPPAAPAVSAIDWYADIALAIARSILAPPPLEAIGDGELLAVAAAPGMDPDEWSPAAPGAWVAWPGRAGAGLHDEVMTAGQLRALLAARDDG